MTTVVPFQYTARVREGDINAGEVSVAASAAGTPDRVPLAGSSPTIRFLKDKMVLVTGPSGSSPIKWCSFRVGDIVTRVVRPGDSIEVNRNELDGLSICIVRGGRLHVAVGALAHQDLGSGVQVIATERGADTQFEIKVAGSQCLLRERESATIGGYDVYVESAGRRRMGEEMWESLSIAPADDLALANSARRSAMWMATGDFDPLCGERIDGSMIKSRHHMV